MQQELNVERFFEALILGDREAARAVTRELADAGVPAERVIQDLFWPAYELVEKLHRSDQMSNLSYHLATRLLRTLIDQASARLERRASGGFRVFACCGPSESEELGAQMAVDLLEAGGYQVSFAGGGVAADEILARVNQSRPDVLLMFCAAPSDLPGIRKIIDITRSIGAVPNMKICVGAGVFNRAEGLAEEIGADLYAGHPLELLEVLAEGLATHDFVAQSKARAARRDAEPKPRRLAA